MNLTPRLRRGAVAAAIASTAILLPAIALASSAGGGARTVASTSTTAGQARAAAFPRCAEGQLTSWLGVPGSGAAGSTFYELEISNVSARTCTLYGYPGVSAAGSNGRQVGSAAQRSPGHSSALVTLGRNQTAHVILQLTDVGNFSAPVCKPTTADSLRVYAPGDYSSITIPFSFRACGHRGPVFLHVSTTLAGTGIPGYSN